jgi:predicted nucleic acid-binding protein
MELKRAVLDACVLFPAPLRDFLMHLALLDVFEARWTEEIHDEWMRNVLKIRPDLTIKQLTRTRDLMNSHIRDCLVTNYANIIDTLNLPDENDRHVLAAAIGCKADLVLTFNLRDFPYAILSKYGIEAISPDVFLSGLFETKADDINLAFERQLKSLKNPPKTREELLNTLEANAKRL